VIVRGTAIRNLFVRLAIAMISCFTCSFSEVLPKSPHIRRRRLKKHTVVMSSQDMPNTTPKITKIQNVRYPVIAVGPSPGSGLETKLSRIFNKTFIAIRSSELNVKSKLNLPSSTLRWSKHSLMRVAFVVEVSKFWHRDPRFSRKHVFDALVILSEPHVARNKRKLLVYAPLRHP
jgi:hypothetical protein